MKKFFLVMFVFASFIFINQNSKGLENNEISLDELKEGYTLNDELFFVNDATIDCEYNLKKVCLNEDSYIAIGYIRIKETLFQTYNYQSIPYIAFYQNDTLKWMKKEKGFGYAMFVDGVLLNDSIVILGQYELNNNISQALVIKYDFNGNIIARYNTTGNNQTYTNRLFSYNENIYFIGKTKATNLGYGIKDDNVSIFICNLDKNFKVQNISYFGNDDNNLIFDICFDNEIFYLYGQFKGEGYFDLGIENSSYVLFTVDTHLELCDYQLINEYIIPELNGNVKIECCFGKLILASYQYQSDNITFVIFSKSLIKEKVIKKQTEAINYHLVNYDLSYDSKNKVLLLMQTTSLNDKYFDKSIIYNDRFEELYSIRNENDGRIFDFCYLSNGYIYAFGLADSNYFGYKMMYLQYKNNYCYFNGIKGEKEVQSTDNLVFGEYEVEVKYSLGSLQITTLEEIVVEVKVNINDKETYDRKLVLEFNGIGYLNGQEIPEMYEINEPGNYVLEVKGNKESVYYTFEIKDLCVNLLNPDRIKQDNTSISFSRTNFITQENDKKIEIDYQLDNSGYMNSSNDFFIDNKYFYPLLIVIILIGISLGAFTFSKTYNYLRKGK